MKYLVAFLLFACSCNPYTAKFNLGSRIEGTEVAVVTGKCKVIAEDFDPGAAHSRGALTV